MACAAAETDGASGLDKATVVNIGGFGFPPGAAKDAQSEMDAIRTEGDDLYEELHGLMRGRLSVALLLAMVAQNQLDAESKLKGRETVVTGVVQSVARNNAGDAYALLGDSASRGVMCFARKAEEGQLTSLTAGTTVSLVGTFDSVKAGFVLFGQCEPYTAPDAGK